MGVTGGGGVVHPLLPAPAPAPPGQVAALTVDSAEQLPVRGGGAAAGYLDTTAGDYTGPLDTGTLDTRD